MKQPLKNRFSVAVDDDIFDRIWAMSVINNKSVAEILRVVLISGIKLLYRDVTQEQLDAAMVKVREIRGK